MSMRPKMAGRWVVILLLAGAAGHAVGADTDLAGPRIVAVAESQLGRHDKEGGWIGLYHGHGQAWCSEFASWCYFQAGVPLSGGRWDLGLCLKEWNLESAPRIIRYFRKHHRYYPIEDFPKGLTPRPGDYAFITNTDKTRSHSAIVKEVRPEPDGSETLITIEGNNRGRAVAEYEYPDWQNNRVGEGVVGGIGVRN